MKLEDKDYRRASYLIDLFMYHPKERAHAIEQLVDLALAQRDTIGRLAVPTLVEALKTPNDSIVRRRAARALGDIGPAAVPSSRRRQDQGHRTFLKA